MNNSDDFNIFANAFRKYYVVGLELDVATMPDPGSALDSGSQPPTVELGTFFDTNHPTSAPTDLTAAKDYSLSLPVTLVKKFRFPCHQYWNEGSHEHYLPVTASYSDAAYSTLQFKSQRAVAGDIVGRVISTWYVQFAHRVR